MACVAGACRRMDRATILTYTSKSLLLLLLWLLRRCFILDTTNKKRKEKKTRTSQFFSFFGFSIYRWGGIWTIFIGAHFYAVAGRDFASSHYILIFFFSFASFAVRARPPVDANMYKHFYFFLFPASSTSCPCHTASAIVLHSLWCSICAVTLCITLSKEREREVRGGARMAMHFPNK